MPQLTRAVNTLGFDYQQMRRSTKMGAALGRPIMQNMAAWFKYGKAITTVSGAVSQWDDASGNGRHLLQATAASRPALQSDNSILFDGSDDYLQTAAFTYNQPLTYYLLFRQVTWTTTNMVSDGRTAGSLQIQQISPTPNIRLRNGGAAATTTIAFTLNTYGVVCALWDGASSGISLNSGSLATGTMDNTAATGFTLGSNATPAGNSNIQVKEVILYSAAHDTYQRRRVIGYLRRVGALNF